MAVSFSAPLPPTRAVNDTGPAPDMNLVTAAIKELRTGVASLPTSTGTVTAFDNTGATDCTAALNAAINAIAASGGTIALPPGTYRIDGQLVATNSRNVVIAGTGPQGVDRIGPWNTILSFTKSGTTPMITARASHGFTLDNVAVIYTSASFTGDVIDVGSAGDPSPTYRPTFRNGYIGGSSTSVVGARGCIFLGQSVEAVVDNMVIGRARYGLVGRDATQAGFSNGVMVTGGRFVDLTTAGIINPYANWTVIGTVFENALSGAPAGIVCQSSFPAIALSLFGASFWDNSAAGTWIDFYGSGLNLNGVYAEVNAGAIFCRLNGTVNGFRSVGGTIIGASSGRYLALANNPIVTAAETGDAFFNGISDNTGTLAPQIAFNAAYQPTLRHRSITSGNYQLGLLDCGMSLICDASAGQVILLMPPADASPGATIYVKKQDGSANTVVANGFVLSGQNAARTFISDGSAWNTASIVPAH